MTDKVLEQVEAVLSGKRVKFLDPTRKAVLALPNAAFKVWMAYWMHESDGQEAYPEMDTLVRVTGMGENTIRRARKHLLDTGWLIQLDGSAGSRYARATNGAWNIMVYRVNDPTSKLEPSPQEMTGQILTVPKSAPSFLEPNVASTGTTALTGTTSSPATDTLATPHTPCVREGLAPPKNSLREEKPEQPPTGTKPEEPRRSRMEQLEAQSEFWTAHFTEAPSMMFLTYGEDVQVYWMASHSRYKEDPLAPSVGKYRCPACEFTTNNSRALVRHLRTEHEETLRRLYE